MLTSLYACNGSRSADLPRRLVHNSASAPNDPEALTMQRSLHANSGIERRLQAGSTASSRSPSANSRTGSPSAKQSAKPGILKRSDRPQTTKAPQRTTVPLGKEEYAKIYDIVSELVAATVFTQRDEVRLSLCCSSSRLRMEPTCTSDMTCSFACTT